MKKKRILCFGDSNTWGQIPGLVGRFSEEERWPGVLQKLLGEEYTVIEEGYNGRTTVWDDPVEGRLAGITYFLPCLESQAPLDVVIIALGVNDLKTRFGASAGTIAASLERYFDVLKYAPLHGSDPKVLIMSPALVDPSYRDFPLFRQIFGKDADVRSRELAEQYREVAQQHGADFLDAAQYAEADPADGIHIDKASHARLAAAVAVRIEGYGL